MQPTNPVVGGTVLRRAAIQSPNFVAGSTGWTINADGTAEFSNATLRGDVVAGPSTNPIELLHTIPAELVTFYGARSETVESVQIFKDNTGRYEYLANLLGGFLAIGGVDAALNVQEIAFLGAQSPAAAFAIGEASAVQFYISSQGSASSQFLTDLPLQFSTNGTPETWHHIAGVGGIGYQNGWGDIGAGTMPGQYRRVASPPNTVQLVGMIAPGVVIDGTVLFTLPAGYRPTTSIGLIIGSNVGAAGTNVRLQVTNTGAVSVFGANAAGINQLNICCMFPTDT